MNSFTWKVIILFCFILALLAQLFILNYYFNNSLPYEVELLKPPIVVAIEKYEPKEPSLYKDLDLSQLRRWSESSVDSLDNLQRASSLLPRIKQVARMKTPPPDLFSSYIAPVGLPIVFTDMISQEVLDKWDWEYIGAKYGHLKFSDVRQGEYKNETSKSGKKMINRINMSIKDFVDITTKKREAFEEEELVYFAKKGLITQEEFGKEIGYPPFYGSPDTCFLPPSVWMGMPGTYTQGHFDSKDNFVYQIIGKKKWTLFSPQDHPFLYMVNAKGSLEWSEALETMETPDETRFPLFQNANPIQLTLSPGEVLYLPRGWVHAVENLEPALMLNLWRSGPAEIFKLWSRKAGKEIENKCPAVTSIH